MSGEEAEKKRSEEVVYQKIEEALLAMPEVSHFTADGFQYLMQGILMQGISQAFGFKAHRGLWIRNLKDGRVKVAISVALHKGCQVQETARYIQMVVKNVFSSLRREDIESIDVTITEMVE